MTERSWTPTALLDAQVAHLFIALWVVTACAGWGCWWWEGFVAVIAFAVVKEFGFDFAIEGDSWMGSTQDFLAYLGGASLMTVAVYLFPMH